MPSTTSTANPSASLSSVVITPDSPTWSTARTMASPIASSSLAASVAMRKRSLTPPTATAWSFSASMTMGTVRSMPRRTRIGPSAASTARSPSRTIACASTVAVVVPSPTRPLVFIATSLTNCAPMLANGSRSWISLAIVTPSLVIVGGPVSFSRTALRPFGPSVTFTASASALTPCSRRSRASLLYRSSFAMVLLPFVGGSVSRGHSGDEDRASAHPARVEIVEGLLEVLQQIRRRAQRDFPLRRKGHQLLQVVVRAHQVADEVDLGGDDVDGRDVDVLAVSDDEVVTGAPKHGNTLFGRSALADEVEHGLGAMPTGQIADLLDVASVCDDAPVGTDLDSQLDRLRIAVDDDHGDTRNRLQHLDSDVTKTASTDHHAHISRPGGPRPLRRRVVRSQARVRERGDLSRLERVVDLHHAAGGGAQVFRVAAVGVVARELVVLAVHVVTESACAAKPTGDQRVQDDLVAHGDVGDRVPDRMHPAGVLVADGVGQGDSALLRPLPFQDVDVGAADPGAADPHDHVERAIDLGFWDVGELQFGVESDHLYGFHRELLVLVLVNCGVAAPPLS